MAKYRALASVIPTVGGDAEKYLLFGVAGETYGLALLQIQEVIAACEITVLPNLPRFFHGVTGLRGEVIPILNLRGRFGFEDRERDHRTRFVVVDLEPNPIGLQVDEVFRVATIARSAIDTAPEVTCGQRSPFILGVSKLDNGKLVIHLDMQRILSSLEQVHIAELTQSLRGADGQEVDDER